MIEVSSTCIALPSEPPSLRHKLALESKLITEGGADKGARDRHGSWESGGGNDPGPFLVCVCGGGGGSPGSSWAPDGYLLLNRSLPCLGLAGPGKRLWGSRR